MNTNNLLWVLGHKIRLLDTDDSYGMIEVTSPPQVPGPPPHFHIGIPMQESHAGITGTGGICGGSNCSKCVEKRGTLRNVFGRLRALVQKCL
jgi:hypothetical protein